ncbi:single-stranded DNA-binding protein [Deinococcus sp. SL84]|uniref:single-stranded DNA-binding protein n=1 Tax=Deinococcus sp. SL84 TaxID=2994663 RepID=UPI002275F36D|nr:single-stranded DNA-binding protein [Deinococcus sp. SL84]MCY1703836.1 single-stranded DNA-binding protein [Deinococcus sp. SL84]
MTQHQTPTQTATNARHTNYDMNQGMISGCVIRTQQHAEDVVTLTLGGITKRPGSKDVKFFEQVKLFGKAAKAALNLEVGEAVLVNNARIEQERWVDKDSGQNRSKLIARGLSFTRLQGAQAMQDEEGRLLLLDAMNEFHISGRLYKDPETRQTNYGPVTEFTVASNRTGSQGEEEGHLIKCEMWGENAIARSGKQGGGVTVSILLKTDRSVIQGQPRYFTKGEARTAVVAL